jgi:hypothetical protein
MTITKRLLKRHTTTSQGKPTKKALKTDAPKKLPQKRGKKKTEPWSEGRIRSFITSVLRGGFRRWPAKYECLKDAAVGKQTNKNTGRLAEHYQCNKCKKHFTQKEIQINHIDSVISTEHGFVGWDVFIQRLYCDKNNLEVVCKPCHKLITQEENEERKRNKL